MSTTYFLVCIWFTLDFVDLFSDQVKLHRLRNQNLASLQHFHSVRFAFSLLPAFTWAKVRQTLVASQHFAMLA
jgi:hypothetical protein